MRIKAFLYPILYAVLVALLLSGCGPSQQDYLKAREDCARVIGDLAKAQGSTIKARSFKFSATTVTAAGPEKDTLLHENPEFDSEIVQLVAQGLYGDGDLIKTLKTARFKSIAFTNGTQTWSFDAEKGDWWSVNKQR